jgi:hypothetical protein
LAGRDGDKNFCKISGQRKSSLNRKAISDFRAYGFDRLIEIDLADPR